jgi:hypothetical protein
LSPGWKNEYGVDVTLIKPCSVYSRILETNIATYLNIAGVTPVENLSAIPVYNLVKKDIPNEEQLASGDYVLIESISENDKVEKFVYKKSIGVFVDMKNIVDVDRSKIEFNEGDGKGKISFPLRKDLDGDTHLVANIGDELKNRF